MGSNMSLYLIGLFVMFISYFDGYFTQKIENPSPLTINHAPELSDSVPFECWNFTFGETKKMIFYSPNYPNNYPDNVRCSRFIEAPPGYVIHLDFREVFDIERSDDCAFDYLAVHDGPFSYSPRIQKLCGLMDVVPIIKSTTRFMWLQFVSDKNLGKQGFKAVYVFKPDEKEEIEEEKKVCRIHYSKNIGPSATINTDTIPPADTTANGYPVNKKIDCTWEIDAPAHTKIRIASEHTYFTNPGSCISNSMEIYDGSTMIENRVEKYCGHGNFKPIESKSNKVFIRIFGSRLSTKPNIKLLLTKFFANDTCGEKYFSCDGECISKSLVCDGKLNCPNGGDEEDCDVSNDAALELGVESLPLFAIIIGAVGGVLGTIIVIGVCLFCYYKSRERQKQKEQQLQRDKLKENFEMSNISANTTLISKKGGGQPNYFSLPRQHRGGNQREYVRRDSATNSSVPSEGDVPDHNSDPGNYKKFLVMDQYLDEETSPCPSVYSQGPVLTTIIERHDIPPQTHPEIDGSYGWTGYGWKQPHQTDTKSPVSLTENIAKLAQYNIPQKTFNPDYKIYASDPKYDMYPELRYNVGKDYSKMKFAPQHQEVTTPTKEHQKSFKMASPHPDITRDLEVT